MTALLTNSITCANCRARNPRNASRCRICTGVLHAEGSDADLDHHRKVYVGDVSDWRPERSYRGLALLVFFALAGLVAANYYLGTYGPQWAHRKLSLSGAESWKTYRGFAPFELHLPGTAIEATATDGVTNVAYSVTNKAGEPVLDAQTFSPAQLKRAESQRRTTVAAMAIPTPSGPPTVDLDNRLASMFPGLVITSSRTSIVKDPTFGVQGDLEGEFAGYPAQDRTGTVQARVYAFGDTSLIVASFFERSPLPQQHQLLLSTVRTAIGSRQLDNPGQ